MDLSSFQKIDLPLSSKVKNGHQTEEYDSDSVHDNVYYSILTQAYDMFKVLS